MSGFSREASQLHRPGLKRQWEQDSSSNGWRGTLPPIDAVPFLRPPEPGSNQFGQEHRESMVKKARLEGDTYSGLARVDSVNSQQSPHCNNNKASHQSPNPTSSSRKLTPENVYIRDGQPRSQRLIPSESRGTASECCEHCEKSLELAYLTQAAATGLTNLAEALRSGIASEKRGLIPGSEKLRLFNGKLPPIIDLESRQTLDLILNKVTQVSQLADEIVQSTAAGSSRSLGSRNKSSRNIHAEFYSTNRPRGADLGRKPHERTLDGDCTSRPSSALAMQSRENFTFMSQATYSASNPRGHISSNVNPALTPNRRIPSPLGRSLPSPTFFGYSSPSVSSSSTHQASGHQQSNSRPPFLNSVQSDKALQAHTASLQHEVSMAKMAMSSLQAEHDKLLAALSRSRTRVSALEKKHAVADSEIVSLTEEKIRLLSQISELEMDVRELSRSRDQFRQSAVEEGAQYVEIVRMASQLEEKMKNERRSWDQLKLGMERRIAILDPGNIEQRSLADDGAQERIGITTLLSSGNDLNDMQPSKMKLEFPSEDARLLASPDPTMPLNEEIVRLRRRCEEVETTLRAVGADSRAMESMIEALSQAGRGLVRRIGGASLGGE